MPVISDDEQRSYRAKLAAQRVAAAPGNGFVAAPFRCPASPASLLLALAPAALATRPTGLLPRAASAA